MNTRKLIALALGLGLLIPTAAGTAPPKDANFSLWDGSQSAKLASVAPLTGPCAPGVTYDPACDVNHDGVVNVLDIQLTAGHFNQSGTYTSDNDHTHLGQTWTGTDNPLKIEGSFGSPNSTALDLSNSAGSGLRVLSASASGVYVDSAGYDGVYVGSAGHDGVNVGLAGYDGVFVWRAGNPGVWSSSILKNGFEIAGAEGNGLYVGRALANGIYIYQAALDGIFVYSGGLSGVYAATARADNEWGLYTPDKIHGSNVTLESVTIVAQVGDGQALSAGDVVAAVGAGAPLAGAPPLALVQSATHGGNIVGVVEGRMAYVAKPQQEDEAQQDLVLELRSADGLAQPGDYVAVTVYGVAAVRADAGADIQPGQRLTTGENGAVRALQTRFVEGMLVSEGAPLVGVALDSVKDGLVWVLVNPQ